MSCKVTKKSAAKNIAETLKAGSFKTFGISSRLNTKTAKVLSYRTSAELFVPFDTNNPNENVLYGKLNHIKKGIEKLHGNNVVSINQTTDGKGLVIHPNKKMVDEINQQLEQQELEESNSNSHERDIYFYRGDRALMEQEARDFNLNDPLDKQVASFDNIINLRNSQLQRNKRRLSILSSELRKAKSRVRIKELSKLKQDILDMNSTLEVELENLKQVTSLDALENYLDKDLDTLRTLFDSDDILDREQVTEIINFYKDMFDPTKSTIFTENEITSPDFIEIRNRFADFYLEVMDFNGKKTLKSKEQIVNQVNSRLDKSYTKESLYGITHLKDISLIDMYIQDPKFQIFGKNTIDTQVSGLLMENLKFKNIAQANAFNARVQEIEEEVNKELSKITGKSSSKWFNNPDYGMFRARDKNGYFIDSIVTRFTNELFSQKSENKKIWKERLAKIINNGSNKEAHYRLKKETYNWHKDNFYFMDITQLNDVVSEYPEFFEGQQPVSDAYENELIKLLGEQGYKEELTKQKKKLELYIARYENHKETLDIKLANNTIDRTKYVISLKLFEQTYNPIEFLATIEKGHVPNINNYDSESYISMIPKKFKHKDSVIKHDGEETGYYDKNFETIDNNETLKEFHNLLLEFVQNVEDTIDPSQKHQYNPMSITALKAGIRDVLADDTLDWASKFNKALRLILDKLRSYFIKNVENELSYATIDPTTGKPRHIVNTENINFNKGQIDKQYKIQEEALRQALGLTIGVDLTHFDLNTVNQSVLNIIGEALNVDADVHSIQRALPNSDVTNLNVFKTTKSGITHRVVASNSINLPKALKAASYSLAAYAARNELLPLQIMMKNEYEALQEPVTTKQGRTVINAETEKERLGGPRVRAVKQYNSWFNRVALGNHDVKDVDDVVKKPFKAIGIDKIDTPLKKFREKWKSLPINQTQEKAQLKQLEELIENIQHEIKTEHNPSLKKELIGKLTQLDRVYKSLETKFSFTQTAQSFFKFVRFNGLAYNISSAMTNLMEGQISNMINAASGRYFPEEHYLEAMSIAKFSFLRTLTAGKLTSDNSPLFKKKLQEAELTRALMDNYDVLQDNYNELQKASVKSSLDKFSKLKSRELTSRTEYLIQAPVMIAILKDTQIQDGVSVWDAMLEGVQEGKKPGKLSDKYSTDQNKVDYEILTPSEIKNIDSNVTPNPQFKTRIVETIIKFHGDYNDLRGNMASEHLLGQLFLMFKRWAGMYMYNRFGAEQHNEILGITEKGRWKSFTGASGLVFASIGSAALFGPLAIPIGGALGAIVGYKWGAKPKTDVGESLTAVQETLLMSAITLKRAMGMPINMVMGKMIINPHEFKHMKTLNDWQDTYESNYNKVDIQNVRANLSEAAISLWVTGMFLLMKGLLYDDEDETDSLKRRTHNVMANKLLQVSDQIYSWMQPGGYMQLAEPASLRTLTNMSKTIDLVLNYSEERDTITAGVNAGESKLWNQTVKTLFPSPLKGGLGFEGLSQRQFTQSPYDHYFFSKEKVARRATRSIRAKYRAELIDQGLSKKQSLKETNKKYTPKKKAESYQDLIERYKKVED